jgi:RES domain-containing protein
MTALRFAHRHRPVYRVVRAGWADPLDASFSRRRADRRWNTTDFAALYCCCSVTVARAVAEDVFRLAGVLAEDLQPHARPQLAEIGWEGRVVDIVSERGVAAAGFPASYPVGVDREATRAAAAGWNAGGAEGVCARSASLARRGITDWRGDHPRFGELAIFVANSHAKPVLIDRRGDDGWLQPAAARRNPIP